MLIDPGLTTDVIGLALLLTGLGLQKMRPRVTVAPVPVAEVAR